MATVEQFDDFDITAICDADPARVEAWQQRVGGRGFTRHTDLLEAPPDVVVVALPHALHGVVSVEAMGAGCHVIVEKPMATTVEDLRSMLKTACDRRRALIVSETGSFEPGVVETGRRYARGDLGRFLTGSSINARRYFNSDRPQWFLDSQASGGGMFGNVGLHRLANARGCLPGAIPASVTAAVAHVPEHAVEACTSALVRYRDGGSMLYEEVGYFERPPWLNGGRHFIFEKGMVSWDDTTWRMMPRDGAEITRDLPPAETTYASVYRNLLLAIDGQPCAPETRELAQDAAIAQAAYESGRTGRDVDLGSEDWRIES